MFYYLTVSLFIYEIDDFFPFQLEVGFCCDLGSLDFGSYLRMDLSTHSIVSMDLVIIIKHKSPNPPIFLAVCMVSELLKLSPVSK